MNVLKDLLADFAGSWRLSGYPILVFGTTAEPGRVPSGLLNGFKHEVEFNVRASFDLFTLLGPDRVTSVGS